MAILNLRSRANGITNDLTNERNRTRTDENIDRDVVDDNNVPIDK